MGLREDGVQRIRFEFDAFGFGGLGERGSRCVFVERPISGKSNSRSA